MTYPILANKNTWYSQGSTTVDKASITLIEIKDTYTPTETVISSWDASEAKDGSIMAYVEGTKLTIAGNGSGKIYANPNCERTFYNFNNLTTINNLSLLDTSNVTNMSYVFWKCSSLTNIDVNGFNTSNVTDMYAMFAACYSLKSIDASNWNTSNVTTFESMFYECWGLAEIKGVENWNTINANNMSSMFGECKTLKSVDVGNFNTSNVQSMNMMFYQCNKLTNIDISKWDTSKVTNMGYMFGGCAELLELDVSNFDTSKVTNMDSMFSGCSLLANLDVSGFNTSNVDSMRYMFASCHSLTNIDVSNFDTSKVTDMSSMFSGVDKVTTLDVDNFNTTSVTNMKAMFNQSLALTRLDLSKKTVNAGTDDEYIAWDTSNVTNMSMMFQQDNYGASSSMLELNIDGWDTSSVTDMSFMFYGLSKITFLNISKWNVSKVKKFDHMFAHCSKLNNLDVSGWTTNVATNMYAMFHSIRNTVLDLSNFITSNVTVFGQMFENCNNLVEIKGLEKFDTSKGICFAQMFQNCSNLTKLDLSNFNTTSAKDGTIVSSNGGKSGTLKEIFNGMLRLQEIKLGEYFSFNGDGTTVNSNHIGVLPTPNSAYIIEADGNWYTEDGFSYLPSEVPSRTAKTYYAGIALVENLDVLIKNSSLINIAKEIRNKTNSTTRYKPSEMAAGVVEVYEAGQSSIYAEVIDNILYIRKEV